jgi:hypothetical protein
MSACVRGSSDSWPPAMRAHAQARRIGTDRGVAQDRCRDALRVLEERRKDVLSVEDGAIGVAREALRREDGLLCLLGISIELHDA